MTEQNFQEVSIKGVNKAAILAALYNATKAQGLGLLKPGPQQMSLEEAAQFLEHTTYFDYLYGRVMKVDLGRDVLKLYLYDRDNGHGAGYRAIQHLIPAESKYQPDEIKVRATNMRAAILGELAKIPDNVLVEAADGAEASAPGATPEWLGVVAMVAAFEHIDYVQAAIADGDDPKDVHSAFHIGESFGDALLNVDL